MSENTQNHTPLLQVIDLHTSFKTDKGEVKAVNGVTYTLEAGKSLGIVGESGSGKSVSAYSIMQILDGNGHITQGKVLFKGEDITKYTPKQMEDFRGKHCAMIFQDPMTSLNPVRPGRKRRKCLSWSASTMRPAASNSIPTSCPAVCASVS